jgi:hypothetical protein
MLWEDSGNLLAAAAATKGLDLTARADLEVEDTVVVVFEADAPATTEKTRHETKSSEDGPSRKKRRLN